MEFTISEYLPNDDLLSLNFFGHNNKDNEKYFLKIFVLNMPRNIKDEETIKYFSSYIESFKYEVNVYKYIKKYKYLECYFIDYCGYIELTISQLRQKINTLTNLNKTAINKKLIECGLYIDDINTKPDFGVLIIKRVENSNALLTTLDNLKNIYGNAYAQINENKQLSSTDKTTELEILKNKIIFSIEQILYAIIIGIDNLYKIGIVHNDLHFGNILVILDKPTLYYEITTTNILLNSKIFIYDFNRAYLHTEPLSSNPALDDKLMHCKKYGECNALSLKDYYSFFSFIYNIAFVKGTLQTNIVSKTMHDIYNAIVPENIRNDDTNHTKYVYQKYCFEDECKIDKTNSNMSWLTQLLPSFKRYMDYKYKMINTKGYNYYDGTTKPSILSSSTSNKPKLKPIAPVINPDILRKQVSDIIKLLSTKDEMKEKLENTELSRTIIYPAKEELAKTIPYSAEQLKLAATILYPQKPKPHNVSTVVSGNDTYQVVNTEYRDDSDAINSDDIELETKNVTSDTIKRILDYLHDNIDYFMETEELRKNKYYLLLELFQQNKLLQSIMNKNKEKRDGQIIQATTKNITQEEHEKKLDDILDKSKLLKHKYIKYKNKYIKLRIKLNMVAI